MEIKIEFQIAGFEFVWKNRDLRIFTRWRRKRWFFGKDWPKTFKCLSCNKKIEDDGQLLKFCEEHKREFLEKWKDKLDAQSSSDSRN